jgi:competence protein ComEC
MTKPAVLLLFAYGAGLATGLSRFGATLPVVLVLGLMAVICRQHPVAVWLVAGLLGRGNAEVVLRAEQQSCEAQLPRRVITLQGRVLDPVHPGAVLGRVQPLGLRCRGAIEARWPKDAVVPAGSRVQVEGRWIERPDRGPRIGGLLLVMRVQLTGRDPTAMERLGNWVAGTIRVLYGSRSGLVDALVVNRRTGMSPELRSRYARAGLVHILSISGFHVGVLVGWVVLLGRALQVPRMWAMLCAAALASAYVVFLGWPAPAARAALLVGLGAQLQLRQRNPQAIPQLAVTALLVLVLDPWAVLDPGAWLSVSALAGALLASRWSDRELGRSWWWRTLAGSVGATLATAPITAALFGLVSVVGIALNFAAIPLAALAVPGLLVSLLIAAISPGLAAPFAAGSGALLGLLDQIVWWGGGWDGAAIVQPTGAVSAGPWLFVLALAGWAIAGGSPRWESLRRGALGLAATIWLLLAIEQYQAVRDAGTGLTLHFLDVGQGDAALIRTPAGRWVLIDAGPRSDRDDAGRRVVAPFLARRRAAGVTMAVISHAHADHLGGLPAVLDRLPVARVAEPAELVADSLYTSLLDRLDMAGVPWYAARAGERFELDGVRFSILHPDTSWVEWRMDLNEDSTVLLVEFGGFRALFPGDAGLHAESRIAGRIGPVDLLKVGHHGSRSATGEAWLAELTPRVAVISSGRGNRYGHPHRETLDRLSRRGTAIWRTDLHGTITVCTNGASFTVTGRGRRQTFETRGLPRASH